MGIGLTSTNIIRLTTTRSAVGIVLVLPEIESTKTPLFDLKFSLSKVPDLNSHVPVDMALINQKLLKCDQVVSRYLEAKLTYLGRDQ